ncbi:MAG: DUF4837 family protein [Alistipes sp.]
MKHFHLLIPLCFVAALFLGGCKAFRTASDTTRYSAMGAPYELIVVCQQPQWEGALGDTLRSVLCAPVSYIDRTEPLFDVLHVTERGFSKLVIKHRNILQLRVDPALTASSVAVQYNVYASPQVVLTLQGPTITAIIDYLSANRVSLITVLEKAERDRAIDFAQSYSDPKMNKMIQEKFGVKMSVPKGYLLAKQTDDFMWFRYEYPAASQGFMLYSYPYTGEVSLTQAALEAARLKYAALIPGPSSGSYMTTSAIVPVQSAMMRINGRLWVVLRGFWDTEGDFMGGPFVSFSTLDQTTNRVITLDGYVFSPKLGKRNFIRGVEHLVYLIHVPDVNEVK